MTSVFLLSEYRSSVTVSQVLAIFTIKTAMLVLGVMEVSMDSRGDKNRTHHLKLEPTWDAALRWVGPYRQFTQIDPGFRRLLVFFHDITEGLDASVEEIEEKYDSFLQILRVCVSVIFFSNDNSYNDL